jgi:hypothetical protein
VITFFIVVKWSRIKARFPDSRRRVIRWRRFSDDLMFPIDQNDEAACFDEVLLYPGRIVPAPGFPPLLADFYYRFVKPVAEQLGLKAYSRAFEETPPQFLKRRGATAIERGLGWSVARQLLIESYVRPFGVRSDGPEVPVSRSSIPDQLLRTRPLCGN